MMAYENFQNEEHEEQPGQPGEGGRRGGAASPARTSTALPILCRVLSWTHLLLFSAGLSLLLLLAVAVIGSQNSRCRRDLGSLRAAVDNSTSSTEAELQALRARAAGLQEALGSLKAEVQGHGQELQAGRGLSQKVTSLESTMKEREQVLKTGLSEVTEHVQQLGKQLKALECQLDSLRTNGSAKACCPPPWLQHGGSCYWFSQAQKSWAEADRACQLENAHLVVVNSLDEQKFIEAHKGPVAAWMGLTDQNGPWRWVDGTDFSTGFQNWRPRQPDDWHGHGLGGGEDCAHFSYDDGRWNDDVCQRPYHWVCETELGEGS
ncbi:C-type lectin domain family 10 member A-like [Meriones unguiculatus]|uniref:C-type lectin domain family 10 member A-like n=1 Tax=Meriones unguiculatus TaxID=10047 RepID=UPI00293E3A3F|nr:C-type lectin domain family 10 member A-like [Meriones unguiculatus]